MAQLLGDVAVGSIAKIKENGVAAEYIIVQQGKPNSAYYDETAEGTWLLRKNIYNNLKWMNESTEFIYYEDSYINEFLNSQFLEKLQEDIKQNVKSANIYTTNYNPNGTSTFGKVINVKIFLLGARETGELDGSAKDDGALLAYFQNGYQGDQKRKATYQGEVANWWLRTPQEGTDYAACYINTYGTLSINGATGSLGVRPCMILPQSLYYLDDGTVTSNQPPTVPGNLTVGTITKGQPVDISWTASTDPDSTVASYTLQRQVDGAPFETINSGNVLTYQDTVGNEWGTVAYRVAAVDDLGASSDWATSQTYTVQDGLLYIEGPADELGTQNKAFTFTFAVKATGASQPASVAIVAQVDGATVLNEPAANVGQQYSFTVDARPMQAGMHTISVAATADNFVSYRDTYNFDVDAFSFPAGGLKVINQDYLGRPHFYPTMANMVLMPDGKNLAEKIEELMGGAG